MLFSAKINLETKAKKFGANLKKIENDYKNNSQEKQGILEEYESAINEIHESYMPIFAEIFQAKSDLSQYKNVIIVEQLKNKTDLKRANKQSKTKEKLLKKDIIQAAKDADIETIEQKTSELSGLKEGLTVAELENIRDVLKEKRKEVDEVEIALDNEYNKYLNEQQVSIDNANLLKSTQLAKIEK